MKEVIRYQTFDGYIHNTIRDADNHLDSLLGAEITKHAHALAKLTKYKDIGDYLEKNAESLAYMQVIKNDMRMTMDDD